MQNKTNDVEIATGATVNVDNKTIRNVGTPSSYLNKLKIPKKKKCENSSDIIVKEEADTTTSIAAQEQQEPSSSS
eukprot:11592065-Ditylum_brightwellii.AAC.1